MQSKKSKFPFLFITVAVVLMTYLVACNASEEGGTSGSGGSVLPVSGNGGGVSGTDVVLSGGVGPAATGGSVDTGGTGGPDIGPSGGTGGITSTGGTGGSGGVPDVFDSGVGDGQAGTIAGSGGEAGTTAGTGGEAGTTAGAGGTGGEQGEVAPGCAGLSIPPVSDYSVNGPFASTWVNLTGPGGAYTMIRPATLGDNGFTKHPIASWGNGITTTPALYPGLLDAIASHGFVVIASNSTNVTSAMMSDGLDWLIQQNSSGEMQGKLATECAVTIGYSLGGGAAVTSGSHPSVVATVSFHGLSGSAERLHGPLLLFTSTADGFVTKSGFVQPCYDRSSVVPTILATLEIPGAPADFLGHLYPLGDAGEERAPAMAWLRLWVYGDKGGEHYFYGPDCTLCRSPWTDIQRKNANW